MNIILSIKGPIEMGLLGENYHKMILICNSSFWMVNHCHAPIGPQNNIQDLWCHNWQGPKCWERLPQMEIRSCKGEAISIG